MKKPANKLMSLFFIPGLVLGLAGCAAKSDKLQRLMDMPIVQMVQVKSNKIRFIADVCTDPQRKIVYQSRFLFVIDNSGSNYYENAQQGIHATDPDGVRRYESLLNFLDKIKTTYDVESLKAIKFGLVVFNETALFRLSTQSSGGNGYMNRAREYYGPNSPAFLDVDSFRSVVSQDHTKLKNAVCGSDGVCTGYKQLGFTDYSIALDEVKLMLEQDVKLLKPTDPNEVLPITSKPSYNVAFISDGAPLRDGPNPNGNPIPWDEIQNKEQNILNLINIVNKDYTLGLQFNTVLYDYDASMVTDPPECQVASPAHLELCPRELLKEMARMGAGEAFEVYGSDPIPWDKFQVPSSVVGHELLNYFVYNRHTAWKEGELVASPMGDGLSADDRKKYGFAPDKTFSSNDGIQDWVKVILQKRGMSTCNAALYPPLPWKDSDNDGLSDYEESCLGTDPKNYDTNGDSIPDGVALRFGVGAVGQDNSALADNDNDGVTNITEIKQNTPTDYANQRITKLEPVISSVHELGLQDGKSCYRIVAEPIRYFSECDEVSLWMVQMESNIGSQRKLNEFRYRIGDYLGNNNLNCLGGP